MNKNKASERLIQASIGYGMPEEVSKHFPGVAPDKLRVTPVDDGVLVSHPNHPTVKIKNDKARPISGVASGHQGVNKLS